MVKRINGRKTVQTTKIEIRRNVLRLINPRAKPNEVNLTMIFNNKIRGMLADDFS